jgi:hypothetical protein
VLLLNQLSSIEAADLLLVDSTLAPAPAAVSELRDVRPDLPIVVWMENKSFEFASSAISGGAIGVRPKGA